MSVDTEGSSTKKLSASSKMDGRTCMDTSDKGGECFQRSQAAPNYERSVPTHRYERNDRALRGPV